MLGSGRRTDGTPERSTTLTGLIGRAIGQQGDGEPVHGTGRVNRLIYCLNRFAIALVTGHVVLFLTLGLFHTAALAAAAAVILMTAGALMRRGRHDAGRLLQQVTVLATIAAVAVAFGAEVNGQLVFLLVAAVPPLVWTRRLRTDRSPSDWSW
jgi:hypothetical protein